MPLRNASLQTACPGMTNEQVITDLIRRCLFNLIYSVRDVFPAGQGPCFFFFGSLNDAQIHKNVFVIIDGCKCKFRKSLNHSNSTMLWSYIFRFSASVPCPLKSKEISHTYQLRKNPKKRPHYFSPCICLSFSNATTKVLFLVSK